ncbi:hypothetical protein [Streptomyces sp. NPDC059564]|uniref:hypothetical protein n=1 Tax=Streptomyces sp. NPDC059564 TaxID=3346865 RepID=UPI00368BAF38
MNRLMRLAVLTPLVASSLAFGSAALLAGSAQAAAPSMTCTLTDSATLDGVAVLVTGAKPGVRVDIVAVGVGSSSGPANAAGQATGGFSPKGGKVTATQDGATVACTTAEADQQDARAQYSAGFQKGLADTRTACKMQPPPQGAAPLDPNYEKGYAAGAQAALDKFCAG